MDHVLTAVVDDIINCNVQVRSILLSIVFVIDFLGSAGLLCLCSAMLDPIIFIVVVVLTAPCVFGFLLKTVWIVAEGIIPRQHKGSKWRYVLSAYWKLTMKLTTKLLHLD